MSCGAEEWRGAAAVPLTVESEGQGGLPMHAARMPRRVWQACRCSCGQVELGLRLAVSSGA